MLATRLPSAPPPKGTLRLLLTDAPIVGDVSAVNVCFELVTITFVGDEDAPPTTIAQGVGTLDLLALRDGVTAQLAEADLPAGSAVAELRIVLCERGNTIVVDGDEHELVTPSAQHSGLKLKPRGGIPIREGTVSQATIDFDAAESIHYAPGRGFMLDPVIRMVEGPFVTIAAPEADTAIAPGALVVAGDAGGSASDPLLEVTVNGVAAVIAGERYSATVDVPDGPGSLHLVVTATTVSGVRASAEQDVVIATGPADDGQTEALPPGGFDRERVQGASIGVEAISEGGFLVRASCEMCLAEVTIARWTAADDPYARELVAADVERVADADTDTFRVLYPDAVPGAVIGFDAVARLVQINGGPAVYRRAAVLGRISATGAFERLEWEEFACAAGFTTCGVDEVGEATIDLGLGEVEVIP